MTLHFRLDAYSEGIVKFLTLLVSVWTESSRLSSADLKGIFNRLSSAHWSELDVMIFFVVRT